MKKLISRGIATMIAVLVFVPTVVFAVTEIDQDNLSLYYDSGCYTLPEGEYGLASDLNLGDKNKLCIENSNVTINLNDHSIRNSGDDTIQVEHATLTINGNGTIGSSSDSCSISSEAGNLIVNGGTFTNRVSVTGYGYTKRTADNEQEQAILDTMGEVIVLDTPANLIINGGYFEEGVIVYFTNATINNGYFGGIEFENASAVTMDYRSNVTINGGTFTADLPAIDTTASVHSYYNNKSLIINDGDFASLSSSTLLISGVEKVEINGGEFQGYYNVLDVENPDAKVTLTGGHYFLVAGDEDSSPIKAVSKNSDRINGFLGKGYVFDPDVEIIQDTEAGTSADGYKIWKTEPVQEISVVSTSMTNEDNETSASSKILYSVLDGANQTFDGKGKAKLSFRFDTPFEVFKKSGKVYLNGKLVDPKNYTATEGSTIITFTEEFAKENIHDGKHTIKITTDVGEGIASFKAINNPQTGDKELLYLAMMIIAIGGFGFIKVYNDKYNN